MLSIEKARELERLLVYRETSEQGRELLAALMGCDLPPWVERVLSKWRLHESQTPGARLAARIAAASLLFNVEVNRRGLRLTAWSEEELDAYRALSPKPGRLRLLWDEEAATLAALAPTAGPYLRSCARRRWSPGLLTQVMIDVMNLPVPS